MIAGALIAKCAVDHYKIRWRSGWGNLTGRREANKQLAATGEKLFGDENCERRANDASDNSDLMAA